ncbi:uncharacterized protein LOC116343376 [Contarinia nasturtii]|uniref:uncharacterized protein LOC116343376 n=1 Tax=Contarinia nasturtii TaxID=265458 RepID=UPI0012D43254|nr:uncharacterized protein LOC116343376 [Contarinia nasturtii]
MFKFTVLASFIFGFASAFLNSHKCPQLQPMSLFHMNKFSGVWYGVQSENNIPACEIFKITHKAEHLNFNMNTETKIEADGEKYRTSYSETLTIPDIDVPAHMSVSPIPRVSGILSLKVGHMVQSNFTVIGTDYESYALVYRSDGFIYHSLKNKKNVEDCSHYAQIWSRTPVLSDSFNSKVKLIVDNHPFETLLYNLNDSLNKTGCTPDTNNW